MALHRILNFCYFAGRESYVLPISGSVLVKEFCKVVKRECQYKDMADILLKVLKQIQIRNILKST